MSFVEANWIHLIAALWFVVCWGGYTRYATLESPGHRVPGQCVAPVP